MKHLYLLLLGGVFCLNIFAGEPVIRVDLNISGRSESEVNEPDYTPWVVATQSKDSLSLSGVEFVLTAIHPEGSMLKTGWSKLHVQSPYYARLANDGVSNSFSGGGDLELRIRGLAAGQHSLQSYHNTWSNPDNNVFCPFNVYLNGKLVHENILRSNRVEVNAHATTLYTKFEVEYEGQEVVFLFESDKDFSSDEKKVSDTTALKEVEISVTINGFELNTPQTAKQATEPYPLDKDMHTDTDSGFLDLMWKPAENSEKSILFYSTDSSAVAAADSSCKLAELSSQDSTYRVENLYSMNVYYWKVNQEDEAGNLTQGQVWSFRPRQLAFRGAEGYGRHAIGGRGGKVVYVTNLNDDGPGSFREAVTNDIGPRTILFNVSGIIQLESRLTQSQSNMTIAGQTAPGKGICIRSAPFGVGDESICRFLRVRLGAGTSYDGMGMAGAEYSIMDHCSISWTIDEAFSSRNAKNMTLQRTLISEALNIAGHDNYPEGTAHGYAATIGGDVGSFHHNLLAHCNGRNWSLGGGLDAAGYYAGRLDIFNNVVYNWGSRATDGGAHQVNFVNNYYKKGAATSQNTILKAQLEGTGKGSQSYYYAGNVVENKDGSLACDGSDNTCSRTYVTSGDQVVDWQVFVDEAFFPSHARIESARDAYKSVLSDVGCTMPLFDEHDQRIINETLNGSYTYTGSLSQKGGIIDHQDEAGGYEDYPEIQRPADFDSDLDGLPDWWETLHGSNPNSAVGDFSDSNADPDRDGYTALEDYLEWMSVPRFHLSKNTTDSIDLTPFALAYDQNPVYSLIKAENLQLDFDAGQAIVIPDNDFEGISYLDFEVSDEDNSSIQRRIGILVQGDNNTALSSETNKQQLEVYPKQFQDQININCYLSQDQQLNISLHQLNGTEVYREKHTVNQGYNQLQILFPEQLPDQLYLLKIEDLHYGEIHKVVKLLKSSN